MSALDTKFTGDSKSLEAAYQKISRENVNLREQLHNAANASKRTHGDAVSDASKHGGALAEVGKAVGGLVSTYAVLKAAVNAVNTQIREQIDLQKEAAAAASKIAPARSDFLQNLGSVPAAEKAIAEAAIKQAATKGYGRLEDLTRAYGALAAASPEYNAEERAASFSVAAQYAANPEQVVPIAAGLADTSKLTHTTDAVVNLGVMAKTAEKSRVEQVASVAQYTMPAAANIRAYGDTESQALALPVAIGNRIIDAEGRISGTGAQQFAQQLAEWTSAQAVRERAVKKLNEQEKLSPYERRDEDFAQQLGQFSAAHGIKEQSTEAQIASLKASPELQEQYFAEQAKALEGSSTFERLQKLWANPALAKQFAAPGELHGETRPLGAMRELVLDPNSETARFYREQATGGIPEGQEARAYGQRSIQNVRSDPAIHQAELQLSVENTEQLIQLQKTQSATIANMREAITKVIRATGITGADNALRRLEFDAKTGLLNSDAVREIRDSLARREQALRHPEQEEDFFGKRTHALPATSEQLAMADQIRPLLDKLDEELQFQKSQRSPAVRSPAPVDVSQARPSAPGAPLVTNIDYSSLLPKRPPQGAQVERERASPPEEPGTAKLKPTPGPEPQPLEEAQTREAVSASPTAAVIQSRYESFEDFAKSEPSQEAPPREETEREIAKARPTPAVDVRPPRLAQAKSHLDEARGMLHDQGTLDRGLTESVLDNPQGDVAQTRRLLSQVRNARRELEDPGHFEGGKWVAGSEETTDSKRRSANDLGSVESLLTQILGELAKQANETAETRHQADRHQRENQTLTRSQGARAGGRQAVGRES